MISQLKVLPANRHTFDVSLLCQMYKWAFYNVNHLKRLQIFSVGDHTVLPYGSRSSTEGDLATPHPKKKIGAESEGRVQILKGHVVELQPQYQWMGTTKVTSYHRLDFCKQNHVGKAISQKIWFERAQGNF